MAGQVPPHLRRSARLQQKKQGWNGLDDVKPENREVLPTTNYQEFARESTRLRRRARTRVNESKCEEESKDPVKHWVTTGSWPAGFKATEEPSKLATPDPMEALDLSGSGVGKSSSQPSDGIITRGRQTSKKRRMQRESSDTNEHGTSEYNTSRESSPAHGQVVQLNMEKHGIYLSYTVDQSPLVESQTLCKEMLKKRHKYFLTPAFSGRHYHELLHQLSFRNEARVFRDLTPMLVPSVETLSILGEGKYEHMVEELSTVWNRVQTMGNTAPKPDIVVGVVKSAFSKDELAKIHNYSTYLKPAHFTQWMSYPFFICEVKSTEGTLVKAERQSAHAASIAVRAIVQLHRELGDVHLEGLSGKFLVFSLAHIPHTAKIYGHYTIFDTPASPMVFRRRLILEANLEEGGEDGAKKVYSFIMELYKAFFPEHLQRIRDVLAKMETPQNLQPDQSNQTTQEGGDFLKPVPSITQVLKQQLKQAKLAAEQELEQAKLAAEQELEQVKLAVEERERKQEERERKQEEQNALLLQELQELKQARLKAEERETLLRQQLEDQKLAAEKKEERIQKRYDEQQKMLQDMVKVFTEK